MGPYIWTCSKVSWHHLKEHDVVPPLYKLLSACEQNFEKIFSQQLQPRRKHVSHLYAHARWHWQVDVEGNAVARIGTRHLTKKQNVYLCKGSKFPVSAVKFFCNSLHFAHTTYIVFNAATATLIWVNRVWLSAEEKIFPSKRKIEQSNKRSKLRKEIIFQKWKDTKTIREASNHIRGPGKRDVNLFSALSRMAIVNHAT